MSTKPDDLDLMAIRELGKRSQKIQDLIQEKNKTLIELEQKSNVSFKKLDPAPSPYNDKRIIKIHTKELQSPEELKERQQDLAHKYDNQIKEAMIEKAIETDQNYYTPTLKEMTATEISILNEKGLNAYKAHQHEKVAQLENELAFDLNDESRFDSKLHPSQFLDNSKDMDVDKQPSPTDDFE